MLDSNTTSPTRREFLGASASVAAATAFLPGLSLARPLAERPRNLVLVELRGGLDGLTATVPYGDDIYYSERPTLAIARDELLPFDDLRAFPNGLSDLLKLWESGRMALIEGVGYPHASMSHFKAAAVIHSALPNGRVSRDGWISRLRSKLWPDDRLVETITHVGENVPTSIQSTKRPALSFAGPDSLVRMNRSLAKSSAKALNASSRESGDGGLLDRIRTTMDEVSALGPRILEITRQYETNASYPRGDFGDSLRTVAGLMEAGFGTRIYSISHGSFDAHSSGCACTMDVLVEFAQGVHAFLTDLEGRSAAQDCVVVAYSEFGRRVAENASGGTDHGAAGSIYVFGDKIHPGLHGQRPSLADLDENGNLKHSVDFRQVYAAIIEQWFGGDSKAVLGEQPTALELFS